MSSSDRRRFLLLMAALPVAGCGFTPAYGTGGAASGIKGRIRVDDPYDKNGFDLVQRLEERLSRPDAPRYALSFSVATSAIGVGVTPENAITRYTLTGSVDWGLTDTSTGTRLTGGRVQSFTSYSATGSTVAGLAAEQDAALRLMRLLADQIVARLIATSGQWAAA